MLAEVQQAALGWILEKQHESWESLASKLLEVTLDDLKAFVNEFQAKMMFALPGGAKLESWFGEQAPISRGECVEGQKVLSYDWPAERLRLFHGPEGVSIEHPGGSHRTVRYAELAAAISFEDGAIILIGSDAVAVTIEPTLWRGGFWVSREVLDCIPEELILVEPSRPVDDIPMPSSTGWQRLHAFLNLLQRMLMFLFGF